MLRFEYTINLQNFINIVEAIFEKTKILIFFYYVNLSLRVDRKKAGNICKGTPDIEFEQDWSVGLGATLRDKEKIKN